MTRDLARLETIGEAIAGIERHPVRIEAELNSDDLLRSFVVVQLYTIGMAAAKVSSSLRDAHPDVPWDDVLEMRELASYEIERRPGVIWAALSRTLPRLACAMDKIRFEAEREDAKRRDAAGPTGLGDTANSSNGGPTLEQLRARREEILRVAARRGATNLRIFGSIARGEATEDSDVDFLVEMEPGRSLLDLAGLQLDLEDLLQRRVDVSHPGPGPFRDRISSEAVRL